ncbi:MAG: SNF2 helicase associated domain-containing protein [Acidobacteria bacterium]|nr:SNF2 helicase associated domain-containing protein [Acidobacteriota bacterium]
MTQELKSNGEWGRPKPLRMRANQIDQLPSAEERQLLLSLLGPDSYGYRDLNFELPDSMWLTPSLARLLVPLMAGTGRLYFVEPETPDRLEPLSWDENCPWSFVLEVAATETGEWALGGCLRRGHERMEISEPAMIVPGLLAARGRMMPLLAGESFEWIAAARKKNPLLVAPPSEQDAFLGTLLCTSGLPPIELPPELRFEEVRVEPTCCLSISRQQSAYGRAELVASLSFAYGEQSFSELDACRGGFEASTHRLFLRNLPAEKSAAALLDQLGAKRRSSFWSANPQRYITDAKLPKLARTAVEGGWQVEAEGKIFRRPGAFRLNITSGIDWFELSGEVDFDGATAKLPELLLALRRGSKMVQLGDGTYGMLPEEWLKKIAPLAGMGNAENQNIRFTRAQAALLDALLASQPEANCDEKFACFRRQLSSFNGLCRAEQPAGFQGRLREYQQEGLGWLNFLQHFSFGGCLADDMGVGKTAQALALLEARRESRPKGEKGRASLVVVPRSLVFNWKQEAARFTPELQVLDYTGASRCHTRIPEHDIVLTTYGTLRRDILELKEIEFDYVILDEAQAIKNAASDSSKAVRLLRAQNRLALSGTPIENHLGELWSLFEFLNPGMLGASGAFQLSGGALRKPDEDTRLLLARALRPFILRRTKEQVARELPPKTEQTIYCEMETAQRKLYDDLRRHYRESLMHRIEAAGIAKSKIQVLEALLRLRQAACHPALLDSTKLSAPSAKLETLLEQLAEVLEGGAKALVFSQFTSLLAIVRNRLDQLGTSYEYLDGGTRDRQARVTRFQTEKDCRVFLISLKAGGLGLNLTAAEYVFILDPWWNPAVEAQAVDRAHRIGQAKPVFAYRLITRDTVEEKVLELQNTKRDLAAAIIGENNSVIRDLKAEDLALLLS